MAKFNATVTNKTVNHDGHAAYVMHAKEKLEKRIAEYTC